MENELLSTGSGEYAFTHLQGDLESLAEGRKHLNTLHLSEYSTFGDIVGIRQMLSLESALTTSQKKALQWVTNQTSGHL